MPKIERGQFTRTHTGSTTVILNDDTINIEKIVFTIVSTTTEKSSGFSDSTINFTANDNYNEVSLANSIHHYRNISGVKTKTFEGKVPSGGFSSTGEFQFDTNVITQNTTIGFVVYGN